MAVQRGGSSMYGKRLMHALTAIGVVALGSMSGNVAAQGSDQVPGQGAKPSSTPTTGTTTMNQVQLSAEQEREVTRLRDYIRQEAKMTGTEVDALLPTIRDYVRHK